MRIVAFVPGGIDDQILFFPTLDDLKRYYPKAQIDVVVEPTSKGAYRVSKSVHEVLTFDFKDRNSLADWGNLVGTIRDREYDVVITKQQNSSVGFVLWLTGIPVRIGYKDKGIGFLTNSVPAKTQQYAPNMYHDLLAGLGIKSLCPELAINVPKPDIDWADKEQKRLGVQETGYILIYGGSAQSGKVKGLDTIYPLGNWLEIIQEIQLKQPEMPVLVVKDKDNEDDLVFSLSNALNIKVTSPTDIGKLAATIAGANLLLCTDSAAMHLAVAVQTYTIALFGPTEPTFLVPDSDRPSDRLLTIKSPTGKMADISAKTVLDHIWAG
jgi:ADP-heptose:LPS heptosyltransferase